MTKSRDPEKCYYCSEDGKYSQLVGKPGSYFVAYACDKHAELGLIS